MIHRASFAIILLINKPERIKMLKNLLLSTAILTTLGFSAHAQEAEVNAHIYYLTTCGHCHDAREFIYNTLAKEFPSINFEQRNVAEDKFRKTFESDLKKCNLTSYGVPLVVIGDKCFQGYGPKTGDEYRNAIKSEIEKIKSVESTASADAKKKAETELPEEPIEQLNQPGELPRKSTPWMMYSLIVIVGAATCFIFNRTRVKMKKKKTSK